MYREVRERKERVLRLLEKKPATISELLKEMKGETRSKIQWVLFLLMAEGKVEKERIGRKVVRWKLKQ